MSLLGRTTVKTVTTVRTTRVTLSGKDIISLLNHYQKSCTTRENIPMDAEVTFHVPGGGDWSNSTVDIDSEMPVTVEWKTTETTQE